MPRMSTVTSHVPIPIILDFRVFSRASVAASYQLRAPRTFGMSFGECRMTVKSSASATTSCVPLPTVWLFSCNTVSSIQRNGFIHTVNSSMLSGHPCLMPLQMSIGNDTCPLTCTEGVALVYIFFNRVKNFGLNPKCSSTLNKYMCGILSNVSAKSKVRRHVSEFVISTWAVVSRIAATAPNMLL